MADNPNLSRSGQVNGSGDVFALYRDQFVGELITEFEEQRKVKPYVRFKQIEKGKSASFPNIGKVDAQYVYAGETLLGNQKIDHSETTIFLDPFLVSDIKVPEIDTLMAEYDDRSEIRKAMAEALANTEETQQMIMGCLAARSGGTLKGRAGGSVIKAKGCSTDGNKLAAAVFAAGVAMKEKNVPFRDIACFVRPAEAALLIQTDKITDKNLTGSGNYAQGTIGFIGGIQVIETNFLPSTNITTSVGTVTGSNVPKNDYKGDFSNTVALVMQKGAVGTITRKDLTVECTWLPQELVWLLTARNLQGHGVLDPRRAVEIRDEEEPTTTPSTPSTGGSDSQGGS